MITITEEEYSHHVSNDDGVCLACGDWTTGGCEPDAREYTCEACGKRTVMGAEEALLAGAIGFEVMKFNKPIKPEDMRPEWVALLVGRSNEFAVPTEVVLYNHESARPRAGRLYYVTTDACAAVYLAEYWRDSGRDGHTFYEMRGWVFVSVADLARAQKNAVDNYGDRCAVTQYAIELLVGDRL